MQNSLEEIIRSYIPIGDATASGWHPVRCLVCDDHIHKKRGGFKFEGETVSYHCFNCAVAAVYDPSQEKLSEKMREILSKFGIPDQDVRKVSLHDLGTVKTGKTPKVKTESIFFPKEISFPIFFKRLELNPNDNLAVLAEKHLHDKRAMSLADYPFYTAFDDKSLECKAWMGRLIIPFYHQNKLIFYQGREMLEDTDRPIYKNSSSAKTSIMYGYDEIYRKTDDPLYIVEGFFDAFHINGVAVLGNELSPDHITVLNRSSRRKVVLPDRRGDGHLLAIHAMRQDWSVGMPEIGDCKDICEAVVRYGKLYVMQSIIENTYTGVKAQAAVRLFCEKTIRKDKGKKK